MGRVVATFLEGKATVKWPHGKSRKVKYGHKGLYEVLKLQGGGKLVTLTMTVPNFGICLRSDGLILSTDASARSAGVFQGDVVTAVNGWPFGSKGVSDKRLSVLSRTWKHCGATFGRVRGTASSGHLRQWLAQIAVLQQLHTHLRWLSLNQAVLVKSAGEC